MSIDFGNVKPLYFPITSSSSPYSYPFHNPNFYLPPEYTPPPTPPHVFHSPQPPPYYTPYTHPYLPNTSEIPSYSTNHHETQTHLNPNFPVTYQSYNVQAPLSCFMSPPVTTTQFHLGFIFEQQPELVAPQMFDESPESRMSTSNAIDDNYHRMEDKYTEMIQILEKMGKSLAESSKILKGISSKPVTQSSPMLNHISNVDNLDSIGILERTLDVESEDSNDLQLPQVDEFALHMFDKRPENEYVTLDRHFQTTLCAGQVHSDVESSESTVVENSVESLNYDNRVFHVNSGINVNERNSIMKLFNDNNDVSISDEDESGGISNEVWKEFVDEKNGDSTFKGSYDESESPRQIVDFSEAKLDSTGRSGSSGGILAVNSVFIGVKTVGFENEEEWRVEEIKLKDIEDRKVLKSKYTLSLKFVDVKRTLNEGKGTRGKAPDVYFLKEVVQDDGMRKNEENNAIDESKNYGDQSCKAQYVLPKINGLDDLSSIVTEESLIIFDPGGYERKMTCFTNMSKGKNGSTEVRINDLAMIISACNVVAAKEDIGAQVKKWRERFERKTGIEGVSAEHGSGRNITHDCSHFATLIGDLKSIKKIYDEIYDTYNEDNNARISVMGKQRSVAESFEVFDYMYKKNLYSWNLRMIPNSKMRNMESARLLFDDSSGRKVEPEKKLRFESSSINLLSILSIGRHGGLKNELQPFSKMVTAGGMVSGIKLYGCFIDMPGRSERLHEANNRTIDFLNKLIIVVYWRTPRVKIGKKVMEEIQKMEIKYASLHQYEFGKEGSSIFSELYEIRSLLDEFTHGNLLMGHALNCLDALSLRYELVTTKSNDEYRFTCEFKVGGPVIFTKVVSIKLFGRGDYKELTSLKDYAIRIKVCQNDLKYETKNGKNNSLEYRKGGEIIATHGFSQVTYDMLNEMKISRITLDEITNLCILSACARKRPMKEVKCVEDAMSLEPAFEDLIVDGVYIAFAGQDDCEKVFNEFRFIAINLLKFVQFPSSVYKRNANGSSIVTPICCEQIPSTIGPVAVVHYRRCDKIWNLSRKTQKLMNDNGVMVLEEVTWQMWKKIIQNFVYFILEDKDDFKRGYLSRSNKRMIMLVSVGPVS